MVFPSFLSQPNVNNCANGVCTQFNHLEFPEVKLFYLNSLTTEALNLVAAGMRRKAVLFIEVDVYKVGVYFSTKKEELLFMDSKHGFPIDMSSPCGEETVDVGIVLNFVRDVATANVVDALMEALSNKSNNDENHYKNELNRFKTILVNTIGTKGMKKNAQISFSFHGKSGESFSVELNGQYVATFNCHDLRKNLIDIYIGANAVSPQVVTILNSRYATPV
jgi:hypothetical protein